jgi:mRNA interferase MazF
MIGKKFEIWLADLDPRFGTEPGKTRPVLVVQTDLLNSIHPSTLICPITTNVQLGSKILRVHLVEGESNLKQNCDIMIDQVRAIDNRRLIKRIGILSKELQKRVNENLKIVFDLGD